MLDPNDRNISGNDGYNRRTDYLFARSVGQTGFPNNVHAQKNRPYTQHERVILCVVVLVVISVVLFVAHII